MDETLIANLEQPPFENGNPLLIAGLSERYTCETSVGIPAQWQRFAPQIGNVPGQVDWTTYGVRSNSGDEGNFDYVCAVEVSSFSDLPSDLARVRIPKRRYAVFRHRNHVSTIRRTFNTVWNVWLPKSGHEVADASDFERYQDFDPQRGTGIIKIWIPLKT
jgi:AraC family transcriptional regulator